MHNQSCRAVYSISFFQKKKKPDLNINLSNCTQINTRKILENRKFLFLGRIDLLMIRS